MSIAEYHSATQWGSFLSTIELVLYDLYDTAVICI
jgi:hypothetical protein